MIIKVFVQMKVLFVAALLFLNTKADNWAYLLAGSTGFYNYRHQSDVAHARKFLVKQNFDTDKIITLAYDDIPRNSQNIYYNHMRNHPNGSNVYTNIRVDYSKEYVNPEIVYASISGADLDQLRYNGTGRFLNVTKNDTVFVYFSDHGAPGIFALPTNDLESKDIVKALRDLKKRCKYVLVFVEACESGSLFANKITKKDTGILTVTAANSQESSYAYYYDSELNTYLGDEFSIKFLEYLDQADTTKVSLRDLVKSVKEQTKLSHVSTFGDVKMLDLPLSTFFKETSKSTKRSALTTIEMKDRIDRVPAHDVDRRISERILEKNPDHVEAIRILKRHYSVEKFFEGIKNEIFLITGVDAGRRFAGSVSENVNKCYSQTRRFYFNHFEEAREASKSYFYMKYLLSLCAQNIKPQQITDVMARLIRDINISE